MKLAEFITRVDKAIADLEEQAPAVNLREAAAIKALIQERVQERGEKASGGSFGNYSVNPLPTYYFEDRGRKSAQKRLKDKRYAKGITYSEWRRLNGLQTGHVDFTFTGDMFRDIKARQTGPVGRHVYTAKIGPERKDNQDKLKWNAAKKGPILKASELEKEAIKKSYKAQITAIIRRNLKTK